MSATEKLMDKVQARKEDPNAVSGASMTLGDLIKHGPSADVMSAFNTHERGWHVLAKKVPVETTRLMWGMDKDNFRKHVLHDNPWAKVWEKIGLHDISQDDLPGEIDFSGKVVDPLVPDLVGRELGEEFPTTVPDTQYPVFGKGVAARQGRGRATDVTRTGRMTYKHVKLKKSIATNDRVDKDFLEDIQPAIIPIYWNELGRSHDEEVSQDYIDQFAPSTIANQYANSGTFTDESGNSYSKSAIDNVGSVTAVSFDGILTALTKDRQKDVTPDCILMNWITMGKFLTDNDFQSNDYFREYANYSSGVISNVLGMRIFVTSQIGSTYDSKFLMYNKSRTLVTAVRRDKMMTNFRHEEDMVEGLGYSTRIGHAFKAFDSIKLVSD